MTEKRREHCILVGLTDFESWLFSLLMKTGGRHCPPSPQGSRLHTWMAEDLWRSLPGAGNAASHRMALRSLHQTQSDRFWQENVIKLFGSVKPGSRQLQKEKAMILSSISTDLGKIIPKIIPVLVKGRQG